MQTRTTGSALDAILGDALVKYADIFEPLGALADESLWAVSGRGLLLAERAGGNPATLLPVYTRLSDAEENERIRLAKEDGGKNLRTGVQLFEGSQDAAPLSYRPLDAAHAPDVAALESVVMGSDAWKASLVADELPRKDRTWWAAFDGNVLAGYCGGWIVDGQVQILKIATDPAYRRRGIAARAPCVGRLRCTQFGRNRNDPGGSCVECRRTDVLRAHGAAQ